MKIPNNFIRFKKLLDFQNDLWYNYMVEYHLKGIVVMKFFKIIALALAIAAVFALVSCNGTENNANESTNETTGETTNITTSETTDVTTEETTESKIETTVTTEETTEETEEETIETELSEDYVSFCSYKNDTIGTKSLSGSASCAMSFTVPNGYITELSLRFIAGDSYKETNFVISLYHFSGDFNESIATEPIRSEKVGTIFQSYTLEFEDGELGEGDYLVVVTSESEDGSEDLLLGGGWNKKSLPEEYSDYNFIYYNNGKPTKSRALYGGFNIVHDVPKKPDAPADDIVTEKDPEDVAKVIILSGQSNAVGTSVYYSLQQKLGKDEYSKYSAGFPNVKILFYNECLNANYQMVYAHHSDSFVNAKAGQGVNITMFGPELGLAAYLSETYPDETFYIIKYAGGGATLYDHYNPTTEGKSNECLLKLDQTIEKGLKLLEDQGLTPKIVAMLWMQGESDANLASHAYNYYELETALIAHVREKYADYASVRGIAFIDAAISNSGMWSNYLALNYSKILVSRDSHLNYFIDTNAHELTTLEENNDYAHYDSTSMLLLGQLFGQMLSQAID